MKYYRLQAIFVLSMLAIYLLVGLFYYSLERTQELQSQEARFLQLCQERDQFLSNLLALEDEHFGNYSKKLAAVEKLLSPFLAEINREIAKGRKGLKKRLQNLQLPIPSQLGVFIGRKGKFYFQSGMKISEYLGSDWATQTFLAIQSGKQAFSLKQRLYIMPISYEQFEQYKDRFHVLYFAKQFFYRYYHELGDYSYFIIVNLSKLSREELSKEWLGQTLLQYPQLQSSSRDEFVFQGIVQSSRENRPGLRWSATFPNFFEYLIQFHVLNFLFLLIVGVLWAFGGYRAMFLRIEFRLFCSISLFFLLAYLYYHFLYQKTLQQNQSVLTERSAQQFQSLYQELENRFALYRDFQARKIYEDLNKKSSLSKSKPDPDYSYIDFQLGKEKELEFYPESLEVFDRFMLARLTLSEFMKTEKFQSSIPNTILTSGPNSMYDWAFDEFKIYDNLNDMPDWMREHPTLYSEVRKSIASEFYQEPYKEVSWRPFRLLNRYVMFLNRSVPDRDKFYFRGVTINLQDFYVKFLKQDLKQLLKNHRDIEVSVITPQGKVIQSSSDGKIDGLQIINWNRQTLNQSLGFHRFLVKKTPYLTYMQNSFHVSGFRILIYASEESRLKWLQKFQEQKSWFLWLYLVGCAICLALLYREVMMPVHQLKQGFQSLRKGVLNFELSSGRSHEGGVLIQEFNSMVDELLEKDQLMPYVHNKVLDLFASSSPEETQVKTNSSIVFCDLRDFTTISQNHSASEVVELLNEYFAIWQQKAGKHGGIIERFLGDAVLVLFLEEECKYKEQSALQCTLEVFEEVRVLNASRRSRSKFEIRQGAGIASGEIELILVGNQNRAELISTGDTVKRAEMLEELSKLGQNTNILVDSSTHNPLEHMYDWSPLADENCFELQVKNT